MCFYEPIKKWANITAKLLKVKYKSKAIKFKLDEDKLQRQIYLLSFINSLGIILSQYKETYMLLIDYTYIIGDDLSDYAKKATQNLLHKYIDANSQILIDECPGYGAQDI